MSRNPFDPIVPSCNTCRFWQQFDGSESGDCRRYAPRPHATQVKLGNKTPEFRRSNWVWTMSDDWCGEYSEDPTR